MLEVVEECLPKDYPGELIAEGERFDVVHDLLSHLAEEMIRMNERKLGVDPSRRTFGEDLRREYSDSMEKL